MASLAPGAMWIQSDRVLGGSTPFRVQKVEQREGETVYRLGERISDGKSGPYSEPSADHEIDRLVNEIAAACGDVTQASASAEGEGYVDHITACERRFAIRSRPGSRQRTCGRGGRVTSV